MRSNSVVIATSAAPLAEMLGDVLHDLDVRPVVVVHDGNGLFSRIKAGFPRFVLLENCFWEQVTEEFVRRLTRRHPELRVVVWSAMPVKVVQAARYLYAGADGYFSLRSEEGNLSEILERIAMGKRYCPNEVREAMEKNGYEGRMVKGLTRRELEVVKLSICGWSRREIAAILGVKPGTVKMHKLNIYRKLGIKNLVEMIRYGLVKGVISLEDLKQ